MASPATLAGGGPQQEQQPEKTEEELRARLTKLEQERDNLQSELDRVAKEGQEQQVGWSIERVSNDFLICIN